MVSSPGSVSVEVAPLYLGACLSSSCASSTVNHKQLLSISKCWDLID